MLAAGAVVGEAEGNGRIERGVFKARDMSGTLFGGALRANIDAGVFDPAWPLHFAARLKNFDLARLTREIEPGDVSLTGMATVDVIVHMQEGDFTNIQVTGRSIEGFSMDRATVHQILMTQYAEDMAGGKQLRRIVDEVVGDAPQRAFDVAELQLRLREGSIKGTTTLESDNLNLTVNLTVDPGAVLDALELRQEIQLDKLDSISANPVESGE